MFENNNLVSFFAGMLVVAGLGTVDKDGNIFSNLNGNCDGNHVVECDREHLPDATDESKEDTNTNNNVSTNNTNKEEVDKEVVDNTTVDDKEDSNNKVEVFEPIFTKGILYVMDKDVLESKINDVEKQLSKLPDVLVDKFYNSNFRVNLYSTHKDLSENSYLNTTKKVLSLTHKGVSTNKLFTEFAYYLDYAEGISSKGEFINVFELESNGINKTPKGYLIRTFQDYILRGDKLKATRPLTYKYYEDYFTILSGGTVNEEVKEEVVKPSNPSVNDTVIEDQPTEDNTVDNTDEVVVDSDNTNVILDN